MYMLCFGVFQATAEDDDFRYIPDIQKEKLEKDLAELIGDRKK